MSVEREPFLPFRYHDSTLGAAFADVARRHADRTAVFADTGVSYAELAGRAGGLAARISATAAGAPGDPHGKPVGLLLGHGAGMVAAILGTLAAGRCYVPLDPSYPPDRLRAMADQAGITLLLTQGRHRRLAGATGPALPASSIVDVDEVGQAPFEPTPVDPTRPAYILFTSGSTGRPKGVVQSHRSILHGIANHVNNLRIGPSDRISLVAPFCYDMSVSDLYGALLSGGALVPADVRTYGIARVVEALSTRQVSVYHSTPTVFRCLTDYLAGTRGPHGRLPAVRVVLLGGEPTRRTDLRLARAHFGTDCLFVNGYGATEASFTVQSFIPSGADPAAGADQDGQAATGATEVLPIGTPLAGYEAVLLDPDGAPVAGTGPSGPAELAIRSDYLASGYLGDPRLTAERFGDGTLYRTGDIVRRRADGQLVHLGRADRQVKVRGHRVELGELEAELEALPGVVRAIAVARPDRAGATELHAYVQPSRWGASDPGVLRGQLAERVPAHLLPQRLTVVDEFPLTASGKVDVRALTAPPAAAGERPAPEARPVGERERLVARAWADVCDAGDVGRQVSLFDIGGTSLTLVRLQYRLAQAAAVDIPLVMLLEHPTVAGMARLLEGAPAAPRMELVSLRMASRRVARQRRTAGAVA